MILTPLIILKATYSTLSLLFGPLKWAQFIYNLFYSLRRPVGRKLDALVCVHFFLWGGLLNPWWGLHLIVEMTSHSVHPWSSPCWLCLHQLHPSTIKEHNLSLMRHLVWKMFSLWLSSKGFWTSNKSPSNGISYSSSIWIFEEVWDLDLWEL